MTNIKILLTNIDDTLTICYAIRIYNHNRLFYVAHYQVHMTIVCLNESESMRVFGIISWISHMQDPCQLPVSA